jgi:hypothetical protein
MIQHNITKEHISQMIKILQALSSNQRISTTSVIPPQKQNKFLVYQKSSGLSVVSFLHIWILTAQFN